MSRTRLVRQTYLAVIVALLVSRTSSLADGATRAASRYRLDDWQTDDGLPQNSVSTITQTRDGYIWLGTFNGLVRFDGVRFKVFDSGNTPELKSSRILRLFEDYVGNLWVGTDGGGLTRFIEGKFEHLDLPGLRDASVSAICEDRSGALWFGTVSGAIVCLKRGVSTVYSSAQNLPGTGVTGIVEDGARRMWIATADSVGMILNGKFIAREKDVGPPVAIAPSRKGGLWIMLDNRLQRIEADDSVTDSAPLPFPRDGVGVRALYEDRDGALWIGTYGSGIYRFKDGAYEQITRRDGLSHDIVLAIFEDREENVWVGTNGGGLSRLKGRIFRVYDTNDGLSDEVITSICEDHSGVIWVGTDSGSLNQFDKGQFVAFGPNEGLSHSSIRSVLEDSKTNLWIGTAGGGLFMYRNKQFTQRGRRHGLSGQFVRALCEDRKGNLWIGTYEGGLNRYSQGRFKQFTTRDGLSQNDVRVIHEDKAGQLWIGTGGGGLNRFTDGKFINYRRPQGLPSDFIRVIYEDTEGTFWIGTGGGLCRFKQDRFTAFTHKDGLPDDVISQIFEDDRGNFWIGSNAGIFRIRKRDLDDHARDPTGMLNCITYDKSDGLGSRECTGGFQPSGCKTRDGKLWFPTIKGVAVVDPNNVKVNKRPPQVIIEELLVDGQPTNLREPVEVGPGRERFEFRYTGLSFAAPRRVKFKYKLDGLDPDWVDAGTQRAANYSYLPPGEYRFHVIAANNDGVWNETGSSLGLLVAAPYWRTWWFLAVSALAAALAIGSGVRYVSFRKLQRQLVYLEQQNSLERERVRIAKDMHDQLGASLTRVALMSELVKRHSTDPREVAVQAERISEMTREVAKTLDEVVWTVNPRNDTLNGLVAYMVHYAEEFFEGAAVRCRLDVPARLPDHPLTAEVRHNLFLIVKEALNNVIKHASASEVWLRIAFYDSTLNIVVEDNGRGFSIPHADPSRDGLQNMKKRMEELQGRLELSSKPGAGTVLKLTLLLL